jgi:predicted DsbA family dithiol-disulfide isomerase
MLGRVRRLVGGVTGVIKVDIWSDVQCPWCYIGKTKFEAGVRAFGGEVRVTYHSFELAPDTPLEFDGTSADYLVRQKGLALDQVNQMLDRVTRIAADAGLDLRFDRAHQTNTVKAHELLHFAKANGKQLEMVGRLFAAYFTEGHHVGKTEELTALAAEIGLDPTAARAALDERQYLPAVKADVRRASALGIHGVPFFVFDDRYGVSGAQEVETFVAVLEQVRDARKVDA